MIDVNYKGMGICFLVVMVLACVVAFTINAGCITAAKGIAAEAMKTPTPTPTPLPTPTPTPTPTPKQTPVSIPTLEVKPVNPLIPGERSEGQWFKWYRPDVDGLKDLDAGVVVYRHAWLDRYTWWNAAMGNYQTQTPSPGTRYLAVWIHEEMFGANQTNDPRMYWFGKDAFRVQYKDRLIEADTSHNPVNRILEFDEKTTYYDIETAPPLGYKILYTGFNPETAGYAAQEIGWIRMGKGNAIDGYLLFEVPKAAFNEDVMVLGSFSRFGNAYWKLGE